MAVDPSTLEETGNGAPQGVNNKQYTNPFNENQYLYMENAYTGKGGFKDGGYLVPNPVESSKDFEERKNTSYYRNYVRAIVRASLNPVFEKEARRYINNNGNPVEEETINAFIESANLTGDSIDKVVENIVEYALVYGLNIFGVENFPEQEISETVQQNIENRVFPYVFTIKPYSVKDIQLNDKGDIELIDYYERVEKIDNKERVIYRRYTSEVTYLFYIEGTGENEKEVIIEGSQVENLINENPVKIEYWTQRNGDRWDVHPELYDVVRINTAIFNVDSLRMRNARKQGFSYFYMSGINGDITVSPGMVIDVGLDAKFPPGFASPDTQISADLRNEVNELIQTIYQLAEQKGVTGVANQSGLAKEWDFRALSSTLDRVADFAELVDKKIIDTFQKWTGTDYEYTVQYNRDYQPSSVQEVVEAAESYIALGVSPENEKIARQAAAKAYASKYAPEQMSEMVDNEENFTQDAQQGAFMDNTKDND